MERWNKAELKEMRHEEQFHEVFLTQMIIMSIAVKI
jgi:hypothetical protein